MTEFEAFWSRLVSVTNWSKGDLLVSLGDQFDAEEVARLVGGTTPQTIKQLRAVAIKFPPTFRERFPNLQWSHFLAALEWTDATERLLTANKRRLSVADMRRYRFEEA